MADHISVTVQRQNGQGKKLGKPWLIQLPIKTAIGAVRGDRRLRATISEIMLEGLQQIMADAPANSLEVDDEGNLYVFVTGWQERLGEGE